MELTNRGEIRRKAARESGERASRKTEAMVAAVELEGLRRARQIRHDELDLRIARQVQDAEPSPTEMRVGALRAMAGLVNDSPSAAYCSQHVTPYFRQPGVPFEAVELPATWQGLRPDVRLTVDTPEECETMAAIFAAFETAGDTMPLEDVYRLWDDWAATRRESVCPAA